MEYKIRKLKTVGLRQNAPEVSTLDPRSLRRSAATLGGGFAFLALSVALCIARGPAAAVLPLGVVILAQRFWWTRERKATDDQLGHRFGT